jgi:hypothetical protein
MRNTIKSWSNGKSVFIELPLDILKYSQEHHPTHPCKISDEDKMGRWFANEILEYGEDENDVCKFYQLIDDMFDHATEYGENWIDAVNWENE